jgi:23S rRNA pseudouridine1911/1915/1917 synthase
MATLLDHLQQRFPDSSKTTLRKMLQSDRVEVNGRAERDARRPITAGDEVRIGSRSSRPTIDDRVAILYEDSDLVVINKAAGLLTIASPTEKSSTAEALLNLYYGARNGASRVHVVHRLDRDSSGVLVFARDVDMRERLQALFATHSIERVYVAIVEGRLSEAAGTFRSFLSEGKDLRVRSTSDLSDAKEAITHYRTVASGERYSMLEVTLETGRRNQIRVHLAEAGHPIVGDTMYGTSGIGPLGRLALHARHLAFIHPGKGSRMAFSAPPPDSFTTLKL